MHQIKRSPCFDYVAYPHIIIFRVNKVLKKIENEPITKFITYSEIQENLSYVQEELAKQGVKVKL